MATFEAVIFDLDGTLADTLEDLADAMNRVLRRDDLPTHDYSAYRGLIGRGMANLVTRALPVDRRTDETIDRCLSRLLADYARHCLDKTRLYEGVADLLGELHGAGVSLAVHSNKAEALARRIVHGLTESGTFAVVKGAQPGVPLKPDPDAALAIAERLKVSPAAVAYVGDSGVDVRTAIAAGMVPVGVTWGFRPREELVESGAVVVIDRPLELLEQRG